MKRATIMEYLRRIEAKVDVLLRASAKELKMFDEVITAIETQTTTVDATVALIEGLAAKVEELAGQATVTPEQVQALADAINANTQKLANAVAAVAPAGGEAGGGETPPA